jgi:hypothetical protein
MIQQSSLNRLRTAKNNKTSGFLKKRTLNNGHYTLKNSCRLANRQENEEYSEKKQLCLNWNNLMNQQNISITKLKRTKQKKTNKIDWQLLAITQHSKRITRSNDCDYYRGSRLASRLSDAGMMKTKQKRKKKWIKQFKRCNGSSWNVDPGSVYIVMRIIMLLSIVISIKLYAFS